MFLEDEDWNDGKADVLSPAVPKANEPSSPSVKNKVVGKKSLLRTLQTLGSVPEWRSQDPQGSSDSEDETLTTEHAKKKRKKKRRRKRKNGDTVEKGEEREEGGGTELSQVTPVKKKRKNDLEGKKLISSTTDKPKDQDTSKPADGSDVKLSRKQWRNRMKNKRKSKNKFKPHEASKDGERKEIDTNANITTNMDTQAVQVKKKGKMPKGKMNGGSTETQSEKVEIKKKKKADTDNAVLKPANFELNKKAQLKKAKLRRLLQSQETKAEEAQPLEACVEQAEPEAEGPTAETLAEPLVEPLDPSASLRSRMEQRLESARFRYINEVLYSSSSREARRMFTQDKEAFWVYHRGYSAQVQRWPDNPVDQIIQFIKQKPTSLVVADFGCGDCKIAKNVKNKVHSFNLVATCEMVTACDMANVPLKDSSVDIVVFCLSLMGTNLADFLKEANRVLKRGVSYVCFEYKKSFRRLIVLCLFAGVFSR
ncbi:hypothetical protein NQD34_009808 [Periophthalmus magnuspinnatus]|nr:hypothetical protein NQD34_009808 [Periophthalmus magnuspinnatus]